MHEFEFCAARQSPLTLHFFMYLQIEVNRSLVSPQNQLPTDASAASFSPVLNHEISLLQSLACQQSAPSALCSANELDDDLQEAPPSSSPATSRTSVSFLGVQVLIHLRTDYVVLFQVIISTSHDFIIDWAQDMQRYISVYCEKWLQAAVLHAFQPGILTPRGQSEQARRR